MPRENTIHGNNYHRGGNSFDAHIVLRYCECITDDVAMLCTTSDASRCQVSADSDRYHFNMSTMLYSKMVMYSVICRRLIIQICPVKCIVVNEM